MFNSHIRKCLVWYLSVVIPAMTALAAEEHIVPRSEFGAAIASAARARESSIACVNALLALPVAETALRTSGISTDRVHAAVAQLDSSELARLAARADKVRADVRAGALTNQQLTYIIIALATAVIVLIAVER